MTYPVNLWIRTVKQTRTVIQVFRSTAGKPEYVERDGSKATTLQMGVTEQVEVEQFRRLTPVEQALIESQMPDLWKDPDND